MTSTPSTTGCREKGVGGEWSHYVRVVVTVECRVVGTGIRHNFIKTGAAALLLVL